MRIAVNLVLAATILAVVGGCATVNRVNPFRNKELEANASREGAAPPDQGQRVPLLALDQQLKINETLRAAGFYLPQPAALAEWPLPGGNAEQSIEHVQAAPNFKILWRQGIGQGSSRTEQVMAPPVMAAGRVYTMDGAAEVTATDAVTGRRIWSVDLNPKMHRDKNAYGGGLAYAGGKLYVTSGYRFVAALDAANGKEVWRTVTDTPIHAAPNIGGGRLFVVTLSNELKSFDLATGRPSWEYQALVEPARLLQASSPAISGDTVVASFASGEMVALRAVNGNEVWQGSLTRVSRTTALSEIRDIAGRPIINRGSVYGGSHSGVFAAIDLRTGALRWQLPIVTSSTPWVAGDVVYIVSKAGEVICISRESGQIYWIRDLNEGRRGTRTTRFLGREKVDRAYWTGVILASNRLITVSSDGRAAAIDPKTGEIKGYLNLGAPALIAPIAVNGVVYVVTDDGKLTAIG